MSAIVHSVPSMSSHLVSKDQHGGRLNCGTTPQQTKLSGSVHHAGGR
jgi:hypothetical protein